MEESPGLDDLHTVENMAARSAFMRLATTRPDASALVHALVKGPFSIYGTFAATLYAPDPAGHALELQGQWGFGHALSTYAALPLDLVFPATRAFLTGQPIFVEATEAGERYPLLDVAQTEILRDREIDPEAVTIVAMPLQYQGVSIGVCTWWCTHQGPWSWNDFTFVDGTSAVMAMWMQLRNYEASLAAAGLGAPGMAARRPMITDRQRSVLHLIQQGRSNEAIASALGFSVSTVKNDVQGLFILLGCTRRSELIGRAEAVGLLTEGRDEGP